jgi:5-methylthioadenosine/S-adenosylhomocysteine deaminase
MTQRAAENTFCICFYVLRVTLRDLGVSALSLLSFLLPSSLLAEPADYVLSAHYVVTMDPQRRLIENGAVAVRGERIAAVGTRAEIERRFQPKQRIDRPADLIAPGLVNTHGHAPMALFRGIADDVRLQDWLEKYIFPAEKKNVTPDFVRWGTRLACLEMLLSGTTTHTDMYYFEDVVAEATKEAGMRGVLGETVIGFPAPDYKTPADTLKFTEQFIQRFRNDPLIVPAVAPHALYTNSEQTLRACRALANKYNAPLLIHVAETRKERDDALAKWKKTPAGILDAWGVFSGRTVAAHCIWVNDADLAIFKRHGTGIAHCPSSNMKLASGAAPVTKMLALGLLAGLGTDGVAGSNNDLDMFEEMDLAAKLQKVTTGDPQALPAAAAVEMATIRGARALGLEREIGSLEAGKRADLITVRLDRPHAVPMYNVYSQMAYALQSWDVEDVMVNGRLAVRERQVLTLNAAQILAKAAEYATKIRASLK